MTCKHAQQICIRFDIGIVAHTEHYQREFLITRDRNILIIFRTIHVIADIFDMIRFYKCCLFRFGKNRRKLLSFYSFFVDRIVHSHCDLSLSDTVIGDVFSVRVNYGKAFRSHSVIPGNIAFGSTLFYCFWHSSSSVFRLTKQYQKLTICIII